MKKKALLFVLVAGAAVQVASGQAPGRGPARGGTAAAPQATLAQLMRGHPVSQFQCIAISRRRARTRRK